MTEGIVAEGRQPDDLAGEYSRVGSAMQGIVSNYANFGQRGNTSQGDKVRDTTMLDILREIRDAQRLGAPLSSVPPKPQDVEKPQRRTSHSIEPEVKEKPGKLSPRATQAKAAISAAKNGQLASSKSQQVKFVMDLTPEHFRAAHLAVAFKTPAKGTFVAFSPDTPKRQKTTRGTAKLPGIEAGNVAAQLSSGHDLVLSAPTSSPSAVPQFGNGGRHSGVTYAFGSNGWEQRGPKPGSRGK